MVLQLVYDDAKLDTLLFELSLTDADGVCQLAILLLIHVDLVFLHSHAFLLFIELDLEFRFTMEHSLETVLIVLYQH